MSLAKMLLRVPDVPRMERDRNVTGLIRAFGYGPNWLVFLVCDQWAGNVPGDAIDALARIGEAAVGPLLLTLAGGGYPARMAVRAFEKMGGAGTDVLLGIIKSHPRAWHEYNSQELAAEALGRSGDWRAVEPLLALLTDKVKETRRTAATSLVALYSSGKLPERYRSQILSRGAEITTPHADQASHHEDVTRHLPASGLHHVHGQLTYTPESMHPVPDHTDRTVPHSDNGGIGVAFDYLPSAQMSSAPSASGRAPGSAPGVIELPASATSSRS